jgi:formylglycine-generating enzyme required for sulfatase activity
MPAERAAIKLVPVPGGEFFYGCDRSSRAGCEETEEPGFMVDLPAFRIDRTEVRVTEYERCVKEGACSEPNVGATCNWGKPSQGDHPVNCIDWTQSLRYCEWVGKRLPTEYEWEKAARGTDRRQFPWGNAQASCSLAVMASEGTTGCGEDSTWPVASRESGKSPYGVFDMAGNVLEWTMDWPKFKDGKHVVRGGSWRSASLPVRTTYRQLVDTDARDARIGFRCAESQAFADSAATHP